MTPSHSANLSLLQGCKWICCGLYCCQWKYFQILEVWYLVLIYIKHTGRCSAQHAPPEDRDDIYSQSSFWDWDKQDFCLLFAGICICDRSEHPFKPVYQLILYLSYHFPKLMHFEETKQSIKSSWYREMTHRFCRAAFAFWNPTCLNTSQLTCSHFASAFPACTLHCSLLKLPYRPESHLHCAGPLPHYCARSSCAVSHEWGSCGSILVK